MTVLSSSVSNPKINYISFFFLSADGFSEIPSVVPDEIEPNYLIAGTWDSFNFTWSPSPVEYGTVFYTVTIAVNSVPTYEATVLVSMLYSYHVNNYASHFLMCC